MGFEFSSSNGGVKFYNAVSQLFSQNMYTPVTQMIEGSFSIEVKLSV